MKNFFFNSIKNRFEHRFEETDLTQRQWELDTSFDETLKALIQNEYFYYDGFHCNELYIRHHFYCAATAPYDEVCGDCETFKNNIASCKAGDYLEIWSLTETPKYYILNCPNENGLFPKKGSY